MEAIAHGLDLTSCDQEPIHIPGSIQPHGVLLVIDDRLKVMQASANAARILRRASGDPLGKSLPEILAPGAEVILDALQGLVNDLLSYSQIGRSSTLHVTVDMNRLVAEVRRLLMPEWRDRDIEWVVADLPAVQGDPGLLRQAWQNLLSNAIKYTRKAERARIEVGSETRDNETVFFVKDNGVGFDMAYVGKLFGVFQRLHRADEFEGTGIGLANVRRIAERHGGRAWAEGKPGDGAAFFLALPRGERERDDHRC